ncbi:large subunit ribosomal protein L13e [Nematocida parisii]|uniref:Ribosomal protein L13E n=1 Tax=Nematocida parisii (strain ERTm3) TaxID=935791 RepID=I3EK36_NEMP3|nr:ribosomal protein L13E [Nematocida parisii ERTm1]EIJ89583.1 ribosomal protein L13E [Nematocida parisii ERTm3]KAI5128614.1 large subunit ribosomal protein L13e [Nematocida parisii]KAI5165832.1 large subunit ribosomal protein L13e [Nematocida sp. AWRm79]KAI5183947.1 large subunit ribosomal protein L13e [Nematocida sp. AWRm78]OAG32208.1 large subunit ribosomal protein L13e [Nematocida sp. ERTm5]|eukprot:XP_013058712.1 ribosomal protein L13E [Nematocida parisii ERTm1]
MKHNNALSTGHYKKTSLRFKTWFHQPIQKKLRSQIRKEKAQKIAPMNVELLRPIVRANSRRYNIKQRLGRGFSIVEVMQAGLDVKKARQLGISVDMKRYTRSVESLNLNVERIKEYLSKITVYETKKEAIEAGAVQHKTTIMPIEKKKIVIESMPLSEVKPEVSACDEMFKLREETIRMKSWKEKHGLLKPLNPKHRQEASK